MVGNLENVTLTFLTEKSCLKVFWKPGEKYKIICKIDFIKFIPFIELILKFFNVIIIFTLMRNS